MQCKKEERFFVGFAVLDVFFFSGFAVCNIPQCPPLTTTAVAFVSVARAMLRNKDIPMRHAIRTLGRWKSDAFKVYLWLEAFCASKLLAIVVDSLVSSSC